MNHSSTHAASAPSQSPEVIALLEKVSTLLQKNDLPAAFRLIDRARLDSPWVRNALGVCHLRLGHAQSAMEIFRGMVIAGDLHLKPDVPTVWKTNFATALLANHNLAGCISALDEIKDKDHHAVQKLRGAIDRWKKGLTFWQKIQWYTGSEAPCPVPFDFPLGDLE